MVIDRRRLANLALLAAIVAAGVIFVARNWTRASLGAPAGASLVSARTVGTASRPAGSAASASGTGGAPPAPARAAAGSGASSSASAGASPGDYFAAARLQRAQAESRELDELQRLAADAATAAAVRAQAQEQILQLEQQQQEEAAAELVLQAKGFPLSLVLLRPGGATVVVQASSFDSGSAARVAQAVAAAAGLDPAAVQIVPRGATAA